MNKENTLVSVVVITYNSSKYILECLDSIFNQTYQNIELIISDDCSKDDTVEKCKKWLTEKKERFVRTDLIVVDKNTGTCANCNRGIKVSHGEWYKPIAGDDRLLPNCISDNLAYISSNKGTNILFSKVRPIGDIKKGTKLPCLNPAPFFQTFTSRQIKIFLCERNFLPGPATFIRKKTWMDLNGYNEDIPLIEDWPMWMKATQMGYKLCFLDKETVEYRISNSSISQDRIKPQFVENNKKAILLGKNYLRNMSIGSRFLCFTSAHASKNICFRILHYTNVINPFYYEYKRIKRKAPLLFSQAQIIKY